MGKDYQILEVHGVCPETGWPVDESGHLLNAETGPEDGWKTGWKGMKLEELTYPYGSLSYAVGSQDDFICFGFNLIEGFSRNGARAGQWLVMHSVINSETGGFIQDEGYQVIAMFDYDRDELGVVSRALDWCAENGVKHSKKGWNQDPWFFARDVYLEVLAKDTVRDVPYTRTFSDRQRRFGGKTIDKLVGIRS
jgi:hypothetical protein